MESLKALFEYATEGIIIANRLGKIIRANPSSERLFGYETDELINQKIEVLVPTRFEHSHQKHRDSYKSGWN
jgi:PAS domain S-box-containing protein